MTHDAKTTTEKVPRRRLLGWMVGIINFGVFAAIFAPTVKFISAPMRRKKGSEAWIPVVDESEVVEGQTRSMDYKVDLDDGYMTSPTKFSVFLHRQDGKILAFDPSCPHLGCHVKFNDQKDRYVCPCHGGVFAANGDRVSGPPPHGLRPLPTKVENGQIWIQRA